MGAEGAAAGERYVRYSGAENAPDLIPRLIVTYTAPSQGKDHRDYNAYLPEVPSASGAAATRETGARQGTAVNFALVFVGVRSLVALWDVSCVSVGTSRRKATVQRRSLLEENQRPSTRIR